MNIVRSYRYVIMENYALCEDLIPLRLDLDAGGTLFLLSVVYVQASTRRRKINILICDDSSDGYTQMIGGGYVAQFH